MLPGEAFGIPGLLELRGADGSVPGLEHDGLDPKHGLGRRTGGLELVGHDTDDLPPEGPKTDRVVFGDKESQSTFTAKHAGQLEIGRALRFQAQADTTDPNYRPNGFGIAQEGLGAFDIR